MDNHEIALDAALRATMDAGDQILRNALEAGIGEYNKVRGVDDTPAPKPEPSEFLVFEDINYRGRPNLQTKFGMIPLKIHYESTFFDDRQRAGGGNFALPKNDRIVQAARTSPKYSCIDIERWWSFSDNDLDDRAASAFEHVAEVYDDALDPGDLFGFYSTIPIRSLNKIRQPGWGRTNDRLKGLGEIVDMTFPSLYTLVDDTSVWDDYAIANIAEAKRIAPGKPCYPFLWPVYHPNAKQNKGKPIGAQFWRRQLDICREHADGVVIWTLSKTKNTPFSAIPDWWDATVEFLESTS